VLLRIYSLTRCALLQLLATLSYEVNADKTKVDGLKPENVGKNRNKDIVPGLLLYIGL